MRKPKNNKYRKREFINNHATKKRKLRVERVGPRTRAEWGYKVKCVSKRYKIAALEFTNHERLATIKGDMAGKWHKLGNFISF